QPVYDKKTFERFLTSLRKISKTTPVMIGICPLASLRNAQFLHNEVPGMEIPEEVMARMEKAPTPEAQRAEGIQIAREALKDFRPDVQGTYVMPPFNRADIAIEVVRDLLPVAKGVQTRV